MRTMISIGEISLELAKFSPEQTVFADAAIVLLHEGLGCIDMWKEFPQTLADATGTAVFAYSRRGYGGSSPAPLPRPLDYMEEEATYWLPRVLEALDYRRIILVGHSDGGSIALLHSGLCRDNRVKAVVTLAAHAFNESKCIDSIRYAREQFLSGVLSTALEKYHGNNIDCAFWGWCDTWLNDAFSDWNIEQQLTGVDIPVLVVQGIEDQYGSKEQVERICRSIGSGAEAFWIPDCKHSIHLEAPIPLIAGVTGFLATTQAI